MTWTEWLSTVGDWVLHQSTKATFKIIITIAVLLNLTATALVYVFTGCLKSVQDDARARIKNQTFSAVDPRHDEGDNECDITGKTSVESSDVELVPCPRVDTVIREIIDFWDKAKEEIVRMSQLDIGDDVKSLLLKTIQEGYNRLRCKLLHELELPQERVEWLLGYEQGYHSQIINEMRRILLSPDNDQTAVVKTDCQEPDLIQSVQDGVRTMRVFTEDKSVQSDTDLVNDSAQKSVLDFTRTNDELQKAVQNLLASLQRSIKKRRRFREPVGCLATEESQIMT